MTIERPLILASRSPRRQHLLRVLGVPFEVAVSDVPEQRESNEPPEAYARRLALEKARSVSERFPKALVLGADTIVILDDQVLEKPTDARDAQTMLRTLSGRTHQVITGIGLVDGPTGREVAATESANVHFSHLSDAEIAEYVQTGSPLDKAGSYGIQDEMGALFVRGIEGDFYTVMGLPLNRLYHVLKSSFGDLLAGSAVPLEGNLNE